MHRNEKMHRTDKIGRDEVFHNIYTSFTVQLLHMNIP